MSVHLGYLDARGRVYDLTFRTTKRRLRDAEGAWAVEPGESLAPPVALEAAMFLGADRPHLLLRPTAGTVRASDRRLLFVAGDAVPRTPEDPTAFHVAIHVPRTAVDHLLREAGGREIVEVRKDEVRGVEESRAERTLRIEAPWAGGGPATFLLVLRPRGAARQALAPLGL